MLLSLLLSLPLLAPTGTDEVLVKSALPLGELIAALEAQDLHYVRSSVLSRHVFVAGRSHGLDGARAVSRVKFDGAHFEPLLYRDLVGTARVNDPLYDTQWWLERQDQRVPGTGSLSIERAWDVTKGDPEIVIAVVDTGIDLLHPDLADNLVPGLDAIDDDDDPSAGCRDTFDGTGAVSDCPAEAPFRESHGTAVAGIAAARGDNATLGSGVCPRCSIMPVRFIGGRNGVSALDVAEMFVEVTDRGADVINNSWGGAGARFVPLSSVERDAIRYALTEGRGGLGAVVVYAAGNSAQDTEKAPFAGNLEVITVGASTNLDDWAAYSDTGRSIDLVAPSRGGIVAEDTFGILTTDVAGAAGFTDNAIFEQFSGTSASAPMVAGLAGLILSKDPTLTGAQVRLTMTHSAAPITASVVDWEEIFDRDLETEYAYDDDGHSRAFGFGRIDAGAALELDARSTFGRQGALCQPGCDACSPEGFCEIACARSSDCPRGSICRDNDAGIESVTGEKAARTCQSPRADTRDVGQPCTSACEQCVAAVDSTGAATTMCTTSCATSDECPSGLICRNTSRDARHCVVGAGTAGARDLLDNCFFSAVTRNAAGLGFCSDTCRSDEPGDCPHGFRCRASECACGLEAPFGCVKFACEDAGAVADEGLCFPEDDHGVVCAAQSDCAPGFYCEDGACAVDDRGGCQICQPCETRADCAEFEACANFESGGFCTRGCEVDADCPGASVCGQAAIGAGGDLLNVCRAPEDDVRAETCAADFACEVAAVDDEVPPSCRATLWLLLGALAVRRRARC